LVVFGFGLLHGLGFASVLTELGLPRDQFVTALVSFNLGVEAGQLTVITLAFLVAGTFFTRSWYRSRIVQPASLCIALIGIYWTIQRIAG
jgi:HupE / UreJ protein